MCIITSVTLNGADAGVAIETLRARDTWFAVEPKPDGLYKVHFTDDEGHQDAIAQHLSDVQPDDEPTVPVQLCPACVKLMKSVAAMFDWCVNCGTLVVKGGRPAVSTPAMVDTVQRIAVAYPEVAGPNECSDKEAGHGCDKCEIYHLLEASGVCVLDADPPPGFKDSMGNEY